MPTSTKVTAARLRREVRLLDDEICTELTQLDQLETWAVDRSATPARREKADFAASKLRAELRDRRMLRQSLAKSLDSVIALVNRLGAEPVQTPASRARAIARRKQLSTICLISSLVILAVGIWLMSSWQDSRGPWQIPVPKHPLRNEINSLGSN